MSITETMLEQNVAAVKSPNIKPLHETNSSLTAASDICFVCRKLTKFSGWNDFF